MPLTSNPPKINRPLHELTHWLVPYQAADDAAHELRGRIINEYSRAEYILTGLCVRLKDRPEYQNIRSTFPFLMKQKLAFLRRCLSIPPLSKYQKLGTVVLQEAEKNYAGPRMDHAHSFLEIDLLHSNEEATRFRQCVISQKSGEANSLTISRRTVSIGDLQAQFAVARRHSRLLRLCQNSLIRRGIALRNITTFG